MKSNCLPFYYLNILLYFSFNKSIIPTEKRQCYQNLKTECSFIEQGSNNTYAKLITLHSLNFWNDPAATSEADICK